MTVKHQVTISVRGVSVMDDDQGITQPRIKFSNASACVFSHMSVLISIIRLMFIRAKIK